MYKVHIWAIESCKHIASGLESMDSTHLINITSTLLSNLYFEFGCALYTYM